MPLSAGAVVWITGLAGAGKSTLARHVVDRLWGEGRAAVLLDGDELRVAVGATGSFTLDERRALAATYGRLCGLVASSGVVAVCATMSLFHDVQERNRATLPAYVEVFLQADPALLRERRAHLYGQNADASLVVGVGGALSADEPRAPDVLIEVRGDLALDEAWQRIREALETALNNRGSR
jgi:adenylylsulfate kinase-like enzyme